MRLKNSIAGDIYFQWKYGFYLIYALLCVIYIAVLGSLPDSIRKQVAAIMIYSDPGAMGLFFMGAIILLEKSQRVLNAVAVSPLKHSEYILSKAVSLGLIGTITAFIIACSAGQQNPLLVILGTIFSSLIYTLLGTAAATKVNSLNQFMMVSMIIELICFVPPTLSVIKPEWRLLELSPFSAAMRMINGTSHNLLLDSAINLLLIILLYLICSKQVAAMFKRVGGVKL